MAILSAAEGLIATVVFLLIFMIFRSFQKKVPQGLKQIPGPKGYPLIGSLLEVGKNPHLTLTEMSRKYGDVMKIYIGTKPVLVLSGLETIKQALVKQGTEFMGRPDLYSLRYVTDGQSMAFGTDSGEVWRARRKLAQNAVKSFSSSPSPTSSSLCLLEEHVSKEADYLVMKLLEVMQEQKRLDPFRYVVVSVANVVSAMCFGKRYNHEDPELLSIVNVSEEFVEVAASGNPADFIPVLQYLPSQSMKTFLEFNKRFNTFLQKIVKQHFETFSKVKNLGDFWMLEMDFILEIWLARVTFYIYLFQDSIRDITDSLIAHSQEKDTNTKIQLPTQKIVNLVNDIFGAGKDTLNSALWNMFSLFIVYKSELVVMTKSYNIQQSVKI